MEVQAPKLTDNLRSLPLASLCRAAACNFFSVTKFSPAFPGFGMHNSVKCATEWESYVNNSLVALLALSLSRSSPPNRPIIESNDWLFFKTQCKHSKQARWQRLEFHESVLPGSTQPNGRHRSARLAKMCVDWGSFTADNSIFFGQIRSPSSCHMGSRNRESERERINWITRIRRRRRHPSCGGKKCWRANYALHTFSSHCCLLAWAD